MADEMKPGWDARGVVIAAVQTLLGGTMLIVAFTVPSASGLVHYGEMLLATAAAGAFLPGVRR